MRITEVMARVRARFGEPSPILVRELLALFRTPLFVRFLSLATGGIALFVLGVASASLGANNAPAEIGVSIYETFFVLLLLITGFVAPLHAATSITTERESSTYETLILSGMDPARIALGKFKGTLAAIGLVVVAISPVVGITFLFGGVSPLEVLLGFLAVAAVVAPGAAFGIATSSRFATTRSAILVTLVVSFVFGPFMIGPVFVFIGMAGLGLGGGLFDAVRWVSDNLTDPEVFATAILLPLSLSALVTSFFVCAAVASLRPMSEDRISPFKAWAIACVVYAQAVIFAFAVNDTGHGNSPETAMFGTALVCAAIALIFMDDVPLAPRTSRGARARGFARAGSLFGPGLPGTTRFALALLFVMCGASVVTLRVGLRVGAAVVPWWYTHVTSFAAVATFVLCASALMLGGVLRTVIPSGNLVRALTVLTLFLASAIPMIGARIIDPDVFSSRDVPTVTLVTPIGPYAALEPALRDPRDIPAFVGSTALHAVFATLTGVALTTRLRRVALAASARRAEMVAVIAARRASREGAP